MKIEGEVHIQKLSKAKIEDSEKLKICKALDKNNLEIVIIISIRENTQPASKI